MQTAFVLTFVFIQEIDNLESSNKQIFGQVDHDSHKGEKAA